MEHTYSFGYWVRRRRRALDLTQDQLARQVGCTISMLKKIEIDARRPSRQLAERLAVSLLISSEERPHFLQVARAERAVDHLLLSTQPISLPSTDSPRHHLPPTPTPLIGRKQELTEIRALLGNTDRRLVTLVGAGGIGKTRLALHVAAELLDAFPDGVWFVELAPVSDPALVPQTVATTLGVREETGRSILDRLTDYLRTRDALLILDNCEHLIAASALLTESLLHAAPKLHVLATSREVLGIAGETQFHVPSLSTPDALSIPSCDALLSYEAVRLFVDRAKVVLNGFTITPDNASAIAHICRCLEGIPLAIELAAARVDVLRVGQIAERLTDMFRLLTGGSRTALSRQQTLRASIDWSYDLLADPERTLLRRLSVFAGGWTLEAAEQIVSDHGPGSNDDQPRGLLDSDNILDLLIRLVNKSLVIAARRQGQETRYRLLEPIRAYAREQLLASGEEAQIRERHLAYYVDAVVNQQQWMDVWQDAWLSQLRANMDNVRVALDWALNHDVVAGLRLATELWRFCLRYGYVSELAERLDRLLAHPTATPRTTVRANALSAAAQLATWNRLEHASACAEESLAIQRELGNKRGEAFSLLTLGAIRGYISGDSGAARSLILESLALYRALNDTLGIAEALIILGTYFDTTDYMRTRAYLEEAFILCQEQGDLIGMVNALDGVAGIAIWHQDFTRARSALESSLALQERLGEARPATTLLDLGSLALHQGQYKEARAYFEESRVKCRAAGNICLDHWAFVQLGYVALRADDLERARTTFHAAQQRFQQAGMSSGVVYALEGCASLAVREGMLERALKLFAWAEAMRNMSSDLRPPVEQATVDHDVTAIRAQLDDMVFEATWIQGRTLSVEQAIALALDDGE